MSSRKQKLATHLKELKEESKNFFAKKISYDQDINRAVAKLYSLQETEKSPEPVKTNENKFSHQEDINQDYSKKISEQDIESESSDSTVQSPGWAKKAYKQIARKTHPDKTKAIASADPDLANELSNIYLDAVLAYKSKNYDAIIEIASQLDIPIEISDTEIESSLEVRIKNLRDGIEEAKKSLSWMWGVSFGNIPKRVEILKECAQIMNVPEPDSANLEKIVRSIEEL